MNLKRKFLSGALCAGLFSAGMSAQVGVGEFHRRHPRMAEAERLVFQAHMKIKEPAAANVCDFGGHAEMAEKSLGETERQLHLAIDYINTHPAK